MIDKILSKINSNAKEKARETLNDYLHGYIHTDVYDAEDYFSDEAEIKYLEFNSIKEAESELKAGAKIKTLLAVISSGNDELVMNDLFEIMETLSESTGLNFKAQEILYNTVSKSPCGFLRLLVQVKK